MSNLTWNASSKVLLAIAVTPSLLPAQSPFTYATYFGGLGNETVRAVATDNAGNTYLAGSTTSVGQPFAGDQLGYSSVDRGFLVKLDPSGQLVFTKTIRGATVLAMAVDPEGNSYIAGAANPSLGFETTPGSFQPNASGAAAFVMKVDSNGNNVFSTYIGTRGSPRATTVAVDAERNVIACGSGRAADIPLTPDAIQKEPANPQSIVGFCAVLSPDGSQPRFATLFGGSGNTVPSASAIDQAGDLVLTGTTDSADFPFENAFQSADPRRTLFRFNRDGERWSPVGDNSLGGVVSIRFTGSPDRIVLGTDAAAKISEDGGITWSRSTAGGPVVPHPRNPNLMCTAVSTQLYCTRNGGHEWEILFFGGVRQVVADPKIEGGFYVAMDTQLSYVSLAGLGGPRLPMVPAAYLAIDAGNESTTIWAISLGRLFRSRDGGLQFEQVGDNNFSRIFISPRSSDVLYARPFGRLTPQQWLRRSDDGGTTWSYVQTAFEPATILDLAIDPRSPMTVFIATGDSVYRSQDGGESWTLLSAGLTNGLIRTLQFDLEDNLWAGTSGVSNGFVAKLGLKDRAIRFSTLLSGSAGAAPASLHVDSGGQILVAGRTFSTDLPATAEPFQLAANPYGQGFLAIFQPDGAIAQLRMLGLDRRIMAIDGLGRLHLAGNTRASRESAGDTPVVGSFTGGDTDGAWTILDLDNGKFLRSTWLGGSGTDEITAIAIGPDGLIRLAGNTSSDDFPTVDALQQKRAGMTDAFLVVGRQ